MSAEITASMMPRHDDEKPTIGPFKTTDKLVLRAAPNGGWIVAAHNGHPEYQDEVIGAYGSASEMISALHTALVDQSN